VYRTPVTVTLQGADDRPGDLVLEYRLDGRDWTAYTGPVDVRPDGDHTIEYRATDAAGNQSEVGSKSFRIDKASEVDGSIGGKVPAVLSLTLDAPASFRPFGPGVAKDYTTSTIATVTSTAGDATLSVADPSGTHTGKLVNGAFALPQPLQIRARTGAFAAIGGASSPTALLGYDGPITDDPVPIDFKQSIGANDALRTGAYSKTLTFTLSTTTP